MATSKKEISGFSRHARRARQYLIIGCLITAGFGAWALPAAATEGGALQFPIGVDTVDPALLPPPGGSMILNYSVEYTSSRNNDNNGHSSTSGFKVNVVADAVKLVHTWTKLYGIDIGSGIVNTLYKIDLTAIPGVAKGSDFNIGDTDLVPIMLHADVGHGLHLGYAANVWVPDGHYDSKNPASPGLNRSSFGMQFITTWLPTEKLDLSTSTLIEFGAKNQATQYYSGTYTNTDFQVGYRFFDSLPKLQLGLQGFYMTQLENDKLNGQLAYGDGHKGMDVGFGPQIRYDAWDHGAVALKWQHEIEAKNRTIGEKIWVQFGVPF
jgi:hypothetical protein